MSFSHQDITPSPCPSPPGRGDRAADARDFSRLRRGLAWLLFLAPFFFLSYGFANWASAQRGVTGSFVFEWERHIPFLPWTIAPYWSIDLLYGLSFLACRSPRETDRHAFRLLTVQLVCIACFLLFPLRFSFERPHSDGLFGTMFDALTSFDQPYNQAPSLHIGLMVVLWARFAATLRGVWLALVHVWFPLIGLSVLTTFQHHFIDIPTGAFVGFLALWIWPDAGPSPLAGLRWTPSEVRRRLALYYLLGAGALAVVAAVIGGAALWLWCGAATLTLVALNYAGVGAAGFQKQDGRRSLAASALMAPYFLGAWLNSRWWTRLRPAPDAICDGVWLGRLPGAREMAQLGFSSLFDLTAELTAPLGGWTYRALPCLDLVPLAPHELAEAARQIEALRASAGTVLVCCALGRGRSASAVAAWLMHTGRARDAEDAIRLLKERRPQVVFRQGHRQALARCLELQRRDANV